MLTTARVRWQTIALIGVASLGTYFLILYAYTQGPVGYIVAVRESSVVLGALLGWVFLQERLTLLKATGILAIVGGLVLIKASLTWNHASSPSTRRLPPCSAKCWPHLFAVITAFFAVLTLALYAAIDPDGPVARIAAPVALGSSCVLMLFIFFSVFTWFYLSARRTDFVLLEGHLLIRNSAHGKHFTYDELKVEEAPRRRFADRAPIPA